MHTRRTADPQAALELLRGPLGVLAEQTGLVVEPGRFVLELRPAGGDKGDAMRALVAEVSPSVVAFVGDDLGDLAAFDAVDGLRAAGTPGLLVCSGSTEVTALADRADLVVDGPDGVVALLLGHRGRPGRLSARRHDGSSARRRWRSRCRQSTRCRRSRSGRDTDVSDEVPASVRAQLLATEHWACWPPAARRGRR